jgi:molybdopterin-containing oxidoreductase family iron-sulfur binding subunit
VLCQQCGEDTPCVHVCPQQAVDVDPATGIVGQMPERCLGCRYCMAACPYHARYFNWWDPAWPVGMEKTLNPDVAPRMRGVVEKCNFCHGRWHAAKQRAAAAGKKEIQPGDYVPACVEACPAGAIRFGDLNDPAGEVARGAKNPASFRLLEKLHTEPKIYYSSKRDWVRRIADAPRPPMGKENLRG